MACRMHTLGCGGPFLVSTDLHLCSCHYNSIAFVLIEYLWFRLVRLCFWPWHVVA